MTCTYVNLASQLIDGRNTVLMILNYTRCRASNQFIIYVTQNDMFHSWIHAYVE